MADKAGLAPASGVVKVATVQDLAKSDKWVKRITSLCSNDESKANRFLSTLIQVVGENSLLSRCNAVEVMKCAMLACCMELDITPTLGFAAIIPYMKSMPAKDQNGRPIVGVDGKQVWESVPVPQFQIMTKGFLQLAIRSGMYKNINVTELYEDEFVGRNLLTGQIDIKSVVGGYRDNEVLDKIVGYACYIETVQGYSHTEYWTVNKVMEHGRRYSKSFDKYNSLWRTDFPAMAKKTLLKNTLNRYGILSTKMILASRADQSTGGNYDLLPDGSVAGRFDYDDNPNGARNEDGVHEWKCPVDDAVSSASNGNQQPVDALGKDVELEEF